MSAMVRVFNFIPLFRVYTYARLKRILALRLVCFPEWDLILLDRNTLNLECDWALRVWATEVLDLVDVVPLLGDLPLHRGCEGKDSAKGGEADAVCFLQDETTWVAGDCDPVPNFINLAWTGNVSRLTIDTFRWFNVDDCEHNLVHGSFTGFGG